MRKLFSLTAASRDLQGLSLEERWVFISIALTFAYYFIGALYLLAPVLGWCLILVWVGRYFLAPAQNSEIGISPLALVWLLAMLVLLIALVVGHVNYDLGFAKIVKSSIGWAKGWALIGLFVFIGCHMNLRSEVIIRAACFVGLCALLITPLLVAAYGLGLSGFSYVSPLKVLGGSGPEYFTVILYEIDPGNGNPRWRFFAPWAPAVGFVANIYLLCAFFEKDKFWRAAGLLGNATMIVLAASRMGILVMVLVPTVVFFAARLTRPWVIILAMFAVMFVVLLFEPLSLMLEQTLNQIKDARADSTRVRAALNDMAYSRWASEAVWFGHGIVERGSHYVEFMPIGSHHNWYGLLFVKGLVGFVGFALPFLVTGLVLLLRAQSQPASRLGLGLFLILSFFSLSENIEALAYMTWPAWLLIGVALRRKQTEHHSLFNQVNRSNNNRVVSPSITRNSEVRHAF